MGKTNNIGTFTLTSTGGPNADGVYTILRAEGVMAVNLKLATGGEATVQGSATCNCFQVGGSGASTAVDLVEDEPTIFAAANDEDPIDGLIITVVSGTVTAVANQ